MPKKLIAMLQAGEEPDDKQKDEILDEAYGSLHEAIDKAREIYGPVPSLAMIHALTAVADDCTVCAYINDVLMTDHDDDDWGALIRYYIARVVKAVREELDPECIADVSGEDAVN